MCSASVYDYITYIFNCNNPDKIFSRLYARVPLSAFLGFFNVKRAPADSTRRSPARGYQGGRLTGISPFGPDI